MGDDQVDLPRINQGALYAAADADVGPQLGSIVPWQ